MSPEFWRHRKNIGEIQLINSLWSMLINSKKLWQSYCKSVEVAQQQARSIASMGKYGLLTLASIVGTDLRHPLLHLFHLLHFKQGHKLEAVKDDYGDQVVVLRLMQLCQMFACNLTLKVQYLTGWVGQPQVQLRKHGTAQSTRRLQGKRKLQFNMSFL